MKPERRFLLTLLVLTALLPLATGCRSTRRMAVTRRTASGPEQTKSHRVTESQPPRNVESTETAMWVSVAEARWLIGDKDDCEALAHRALEESPDSIDGRCLLADVYLNQGRAEDGVAELRGALELAPKDARVHYGLGLAYDELGKSELAVHHLQMAHQLAPENEQYSVGYETLQAMVPTRPRVSIENPATVAQHTSDSGTADESESGPQQAGLQPSDSIVPASFIPRLGAMRRWFTQ